MITQEFTPETITLPRNALPNNLYKIQSGEGFDSSVESVFVVRTYETGKYNVVYMNQGSTRNLRTLIEDPEKAIREARDVALDWLHEGHPDHTETIDSLPEFDFSQLEKAIETS